MIKITNLEYLRNQRKTVFSRIETVFKLKIDSLEIKNEQVLGIYGKNGSGKTTLVEIITGLRKLEKGEIEITDQEPLFSAVFQDSQFDELAIGKILNFLNQANRKQANTVALLQDFELINLQNSKFKELSFGQQQRFRLICAFLKPFSILILDEITTGMDAYWKRKVEKIIREMIETKKTVIMISHNEDEIIKYCQRVLFIECGEIKEDFLLEGTLDNKKKTFFQKVPYLTEEGEGEGNEQYFTNY